MPCAGLAKSAHLLRKHAGMLAPDGRCKTLDAAGDGYVRAEDCIAMLLQALDDSQAAPAAVRCILQGSAVSRCGLGVCPIS